MEFPELGKRCAVTTCRQLEGKLNRKALKTSKILENGLQFANGNFLPITCLDCGNVFCKEHNIKEGHDCHQTGAVKDATEPLLTESYECYLKDCGVKELVPVLCPECEKNFCMRHRHQQDHHCEKLDTKFGNEISPKAKVESIIGRELKTATREPKSKKSSKTAAKVALMKLKLHAVGDKRIPQGERDYFNIVLVNLDDDKQQETCPMFFSKKWTVGRAIDYIATFKGISNKNNISGEKKLHLFGKNGIVINPSECLESLVDENVIDTDVRTLKLSYCK